MADNTVLNSGIGGDNISTDDLTTKNGQNVSGEKVQRNKMGFGADGDFTDVTRQNLLPVDGGQDFTQELLQAILVELRTMNVLLKDALNAKIDLEAIRQDESDTMAQKEFYTT